jgi:hypothetical protein
MVARYFYDQGELPMSEFVWLRQGDNLPAVAVAQLLLNRTSSGAMLKVDGAFGRKTAAAVKEFQSPRRLVVDGVIGKNTWPRLKNTENLQIIDCIDVFDPDLYTSERRFLIEVGGNPITLGGMSNGIEQAVTEILRRAAGAFLVRFHGHGAPGAAGISDGHGDLPSRSSFEDNPETMRALKRLKRAFGHYGCIQFMHCQTGRGISGQRFLRKVADATGVPATAAYADQYASTLRETLRYEGATRTCCPSSGDLHTWSAGRRQFVGMTVR